MPNFLGKASPATVREQRIRSARNIYLGRYTTRIQTAGTEMTYDGERHLLIFGPNGSGKGTRLLVPKLLTAQRSHRWSSIDPKGELAAITAAERRTIGES